MLAMCANAQPGLHKKRPTRLFGGPGLCYQTVIYQGLRPTMCKRSWSGFFCVRAFPDARSSADRIAYWRGAVGLAGVALLAGGKAGVAGLAGGFTVRSMGA